MWKAVPIVFATLALAGCTERELQRGAVGAAIGAGSAVILDGNPVKGAIIGGAGSIILDKI